MRPRYQEDPLATFDGAPANDFDVCILTCIFTEGDMADAAAQTVAKNVAAPEFTAPHLSLPKGGGALRSIGETFATNPVTGTGALSIPIAASPGRSGFGPQLALSYDSGIGNGLFGLGWHLPLPSITRRTDKGLPRYDDAVESRTSDIFLISGAEDLVPVLHDEGEAGWFAALPSEQAGFIIQSFRPRTEGLFAQIERWTCRESGATHWRSISRDNVLTIYGLDENSRIADPADPLRVFSWLICRSYDDKGNAILYDYDAENDANIDVARPSERNRERRANRYVKHIRYGNRAPLLLDPACPGMRASPLAPHGLETADWMFSLVFDYGEGHLAEHAATPGKWPRADAFYEAQRPWPARPDAFSSFRAGFELRTYRLCRQVLMFHHFPTALGTAECLVKATRFSYQERAFGSCLERVVLTGYARQKDGQYIGRDMPALELAYTQSPLEPEGPKHFPLADIPPESLENLPGGVDGGTYRWADLDGEGIAGIFTEQSGAWLYKHNLGHGRFGAMETVRTQPAVAQGRARQHHLMDVAGDGNMDLVDFVGSAPGFYGRTLDAGWEGFRPFLDCPVLDWNNANLRFVDLTGDGIADMLITEDDAYTWHPSLLQEGFGRGVRVRIPLEEEETGPRAIFADPEQSIYLADMNGDGLSDIVRIRNGEVCYWPNRGYGKFGAKITMDGAPRFDRIDLFDRRHLRLADTDGTGTTDIIYLDGDGAQIYLNRSGNALSSARCVTTFPPVDDLTAVDAIDLLGRGTSCLVWSSPLPNQSGRCLRYIDLMCGLKPHLLERIDNNMGAKTRIEYASSTEFYLADKLAGTPWITKLPFPVHVVKRVEIYDQVSRNRIITRYSYHHGFYDGLEREFRGFARVDQLDTEGFASFRPHGEEASNWDEAYHVPPVLTKTWFHTGVFLDGGRVSRHLAREYYHGTENLAPLPDTILPAGLTPFEAREACRSLKGSMLRQEVYALDGTARANVPYSTSEYNFIILPVQPRGHNRYAVFFTHPRETLTAHYERRAHDPRISHEAVLKVDAYGNLLRAVAIGYPRQRPEFPAQAELLATLTENDFTNAVLQPQTYRAPLLAATKTFQLTGPDLHGAEVLPFAALAGMAAAAIEIAYTATPVPGQVEKRLLSEALTQFRRNDLAGLLPCGRLESLALPGENFKRALSDGLLELFVGKATPEALRDVLGARAAGYRDVGGSGPFFSPSGRVFYTPAPLPPAQELTFALENFFLPHRYRDAFGHEAIAGYDEHHLAATYTRDAAGNETHAAFDYRVLQLDCLTDTNGNRAQARYDALGMLAGTALLGKDDGSAEGDSFERFVTDLSPGEIAAYFAATAPADLAVKYLGTATSRIVYDWHGVPACTATIARETHVSALAHGKATRVQLQFAYADGFGRLAQTKLQAEPGRLDIHDPHSPVINPRWVGTGAKIYNNKGKPVREYEPFFSATPQYGIERWGVSSVLFYDPVERVVAALHPDHSFEKTEFDAWKQAVFDANDTVTFNPLADPLLGPFFRLLPEADYLPSWYQERIGGAFGPHERAAAEKAGACADTPAMTHFDTLGRSFLSISDNGVDASGGRLLYATRSVLDIEGNPREVIDALGRVIQRNDYDMLGGKLRQLSMEAGERWILTDVAAKPLRTWNSRNYALLMEYDMLHRPLRSFVRGGNEGEQNFGHEIMFERMVYGDSPESGLNAAERRARNLGGKIFRHYDGAGLVEAGRYDFKGNSLTTARRFAQDFRTTPDWAETPTLEADLYTGDTKYDALNRPILVTAPDGSLFRPRFNDASLLEAVEVNLRGAKAEFDGSLIWQCFVEHINYDAKGQRSYIGYGNGAQTSYRYDPRSLRLTNLKTRRKSGDGAALFAEPGCVQDLHYTYDAVGNITRIADAALRPVFHANHRVEPVCNYTYDPLYRLLQATGREHAAQSAFSFAPKDGDYRDFPFVGGARLHDLQSVRSYVERYEYDPVGNFIAMRHHAEGGNWEREYGYEAPSLLEPWRHSNRLSWTSAQDGPWTLTERYRYDTHGNVTQMPHLPRLDWDFHDQLRTTSRQVVNEGVSEATWYVYDAAGQRVRKISLRPGGGKRDERRYIGGFEVFRSFGVHGVVELERETLHIMDDKQRIALVDTLVTEHRRAVDTPLSLLRYQLANHLGSACLEMDASGNLITYEEYNPYGSSTFQVAGGIEVSAKRYRYSAKERDSENGFYYYGARYYAAWLGRWTAADPSGLKDGANLYRFVSCRPIVLSDQNGQEGGWFAKAKEAARNSSTVQAGLGFVYGSVQAIAPFGTMAPSPPGSSQAFEVGKAVGQFATGMLEVYGSGVGVTAGLTVGAAGVAGTGAAAIGEVATLGAATPVAAPVAAVSVGAVVGGAAIVTGAVAVGAAGVYNMHQGLAALHTAMSTGGGSAPPEPPKPTDPAPPAAPPGDPAPPPPPNAPPTETPPPTTPPAPPAGEPAAPATPAAKAPDAAPAAPVKVPQKRGPKVGMEGPHNQTIKKTADALEAQGNKVIAGGKRPNLPEAVVPTPGGVKATRRPDILYKTPKNEVKAVNVGKVKADNVTPVPREAAAQKDLQGAGIPTDFVPYNKK